MISGPFLHMVLLVLKLVNLKMIGNVVLYKLNRIDVNSFKSDLTDLSPE